MIIPPMMTTKRITRNVKKFVDACFFLFERFGGVPSRDSCMAPYISLFHGSLFLAMMPFLCYTNTMIIEILPEQCIACGLCHTYNKIFDYDIDGLVRFENNETVLEIPSDPSLTQAAKTCPTHAIKIKSELT